MGRKTRLVRDFQFVKDGLAVDLIGIIAVGGGKVAGGQGSHIIAPVGDAGGAFRGPACEPGFFPAGRIGLFAFFQKPFWVEHGDVFGTVDGNGFDVVGA